MAVFVVTWNINKERSSYALARQQFLSSFEKYETIYDSALETVRWVSTNITAQQLETDLQRTLDQNDRIFVSQVFGGTYYGWLPNEIWNWIQARI